MATNPAALASIAATISADVASRGSIARVPERNASTTHEFSVLSVNTTSGLIPTRSAATSTHLRATPGPKARRPVVAPQPEPIAVLIEKLPTTSKVATVASKDSSPARTTSELAPIRTRVTRPYLPFQFILGTSLSSFADDDFNLNGVATTDYGY